MRFQNGQVIDLAILKPGFELDRPFQNQGRFQNGQGFDTAGNNSLKGLKYPGLPPDKIIALGAAGLQKMCYTPCSDNKYERIHNEYVLHSIAHHKHIDFWYPP